MKRLENWDKLLSDYLTAMRFTPFKWGENDCVLFAVKGVEAMTGVNTYQEYLGYKSKTGALRIIRDGGGIDAIVSKHFGPGHRNVMKAKRGDLVLIKDTDMRLGLVDDSGQFALVPADNGLVKEKLSKVWRVWSI